MPAPTTRIGPAFWACELHAIALHRARISRVAGARLDDRPPSNTASNTASKMDDVRRVPCADIGKTIKKSRLAAAQMRGLPTLDTVA